MRSPVALAALICAVALSSASQAVKGADPSCLEYGPAVVTLSGTITRHFYYGPPNYGEDPATDAKEIHWFLNLDEPICVNGKDEDSPEMEGETGVRRLQIVHLNGYPGSRGLMGHRISVTGTLFHAATAHHHTKVLIWADKTTKLPRP
jgi:hypothetical protein